MVKIKVCGITTAEDAEAAVAAGADALGFVFFPRSPRAVSAETAAKIVSTLGPFTVTVGVFVNEQAATVNGIVRQVGLDRVQFHGDETPGCLKEITVPVIKAFRVRDRDVLREIPRFGTAAFLLDAYSDAEFGGTGTRFDWEIAREAAGMGRLILSGGLGPDNVAQAISRVRPYAVDVSSGVSTQADPRRKDRDKMKRFVEAARSGWVDGA